MAACCSRELGYRGMPRSEHWTGHGGEEEEHRAALGSVGVAVGDHGGDALRVGVHHGHGYHDNLFPSSDFMVQIPWSNFLKNQVTKSFGPSLGVNWMWTKKNDHAPQSEYVHFFNAFPIRTILGFFIYLLFILVWPFSCLLLASFVFTPCFACF